MKRINVEEYLVDDKGNKSSTRLFSWYLLKFFKWFNVIVPILGAGFIYLIKDSIDLNIILSLGMMYIVFNALLGIMIFTPKQLGKIQEIKELIEIAKK